MFFRYGRLFGLAAAMMLVNLACRQSDGQIISPALTQIQELKLNIDNPAGITYTIDYTGFWIVDGGNSKIVRTDLEGNVIEVLPYTGNRITSISLDRSSGTLWITEKKKRELVNLSLSGEVKKRLHIAGGKGGNKIPGGIFCGEGSTLYVLNEAAPPSMIKMNSDGNIEQQYNFYFTPDASEIYFDNAKGNYYLLSYQSEMIYRWNPLKAELQRIHLPGKNYSGMTFNPEQNSFAVVNSRQQTLEVFSNGIVINN